MRSLAATGQAVLDAETRNADPNAFDAEDGLVGRRGWLGGRWASKTAVGWVRVRERYVNSGCENDVSPSKRKVRFPSEKLASPARALTTAAENLCEVCDLTDEASNPARTTRRGDATLFFTAPAFAQLQRDLARPRGDSDHLRMARERS